MKKIIAAIMILLVCVGTIFASTVVDAVSTKSQLDGKSASVVIELGIDPSKMYFYSFGFSNDSEIKDLATEGVQNVPSAAATTLDLKYDPVTSVATNENPLYFYYKARTNQSFSFDIETVGALTDKNGADPLNWTVAFEKQDISGSKAATFTSDKISSNGNTKTTVNVVPSSDSNETYCAYKILINTEVIPLLEQTAEFSGTLKMSVKAE